MRSAHTVGSTGVATIIPAFNASATIGDAIASVLAQTAPCREIVVVDDGSSDDTAAVAASCGSQVVVHRQRNQGVAHARNIGVKLTTSELIAFLDADDLWHPAKLEVQQLALRTYPDAVACYTNGVAVEGPRAFPSDSRLEPDFRLVSGLRQVVRNPYWGTPTVMVRRSAFEACSGFDETLRTAEDIDLWLKLGALGKVVHLRSPAVGVRRLSSGLSRSSGARGDMNVLLVMDRFVERNPVFAVQSARLIRQMKSRVLTRIGSELLGKNAVRDARSHLLRSAALYPWSFRTLYLLAKTLR